MNELFIKAERQLSSLSPKLNFWIASRSPFAQAFARDTYGVDVVLAEPKGSWKTTTLDLGGSSPASMGMGQGYCELNIDPWTVTQNFGPKDDKDHLIWLHGVLSMNSLIV
jgi:hypothetical protein